MSELTGKTVAGYPIEKLLAKGSYSDTWQISTSGAAMAVKILRDNLRTDANLGTQVSKGWEISRGAQHENLVTAFGAGIDPDVGAYCLQELVVGKSLRQNMLDGSKLAWRDFLIIGEQLFSALKVLHAAGIVHGDIWTGSILITQDQDLKLEGAGGLMYLTRRPSEVVAGQSLSYQAPEILHGSPVSAEGDIYAAGGCMYAVLAGNDPYPPESAERLIQIVTDRKLPRVTGFRDDLPPESDEIIGRLMSKDPTQRYGSAADVLADILRLKDGKPLGPLKGGKPAAAALASSAPPPSAPPTRAGNSNSSMQATQRPKSNINAAVGSRPPSAGRSGFSGAINTRKPGSGMGSAVGTSGSALKAIKDGTTATAHSRIFGRLDTHVKSTIPQSDLEKRGDDLYRQGQLPLALNCWRESYDTTPHTGLKVKLELAERDVKREAYNMGLEEARMRLDDGDYSGAIARAREALLTAEDDQQRNEVLNVERQAIDKFEQEKYGNRVKMIVGGIALLVLAIASVLFLTRSKGTPPPETPVVTPTPPTPTPAIPAVPAPPPPGTLEKKEIPGAQATVMIKAPWSVQGAEFVYLANSQRTAVLTAGKLPEGTEAVDVLKEIRGSPTFKDQKIVEELEAAFVVDGQRVAKTTVRYTDDKNQPHLHMYYVIGAPDKSPRLVEVDGREDLLTPDVREQIQTVLNSWKYK